MAFTFTNFQPSGPQEYGLQNLISQALGGYKAASEAKFQQPLLTEELKKAQQYNQYYPQDIMSQIGLRGAQAGEAGARTGLIGSQTQGQNIENQYAPQKMQANIAHLIAQSKYYNQGGPGGSTGNKDQTAFVSNVYQDNPEFSEEQLREAANAIASGQSTLQDGTQINMSPLTKMSLDRALRSTTTAGQLNSQLNANKAEQEIDVLQQYATAPMQKYGDTFAGYSPQQITDTFKNDEKSQKELGQLIASQALQYEIAQNRIRLANGQPGVHSTQELMKLSGQTLKTQFPKLTAAARTEAARYLDEALKAGNKARQKGGLGASSLISKALRGKGESYSTPNSADKKEAQDKGSREEAQHTADYARSKLGIDMSPMDVLQAQSEGVKRLSQLKDWWSKRHAR